MIYLRKANKSDLPLILAWRNNPLIWMGTYTQRSPISWETHEAWWDSRKDHISFMAVLLQNDSARDIGVIHISPLTYWSPEIGIILDVAEWSKGYGTEVFRLGCEWLKSKGYKWTSTTVLDTNTPMIRVLEKLGFEEFSDARKGELWYRREL